jgi:hypothetical protein
MTKQVIEIAVDDQRSVFAEVSSAEGSIAGDGLSPAASIDDVLARTGSTITAALENVIVPAVTTMFAQISRISPKEVELEFGLKMSGEVGLVFASTQSEGHIQVTLRW